MCKAPVSLCCRDLNRPSVQRGWLSVVTRSPCSRIYPETMSRVLAAPIAAAALRTEASGLPRPPSRADYRSSARMRDLSWAQGVPHERGHDRSGVDALADYRGGIRVVVRGAVRWHRDRGRDGRR